MRKFIFAVLITAGAWYIFTRVIRRFYRVQNSTAYVPASTVPNTNKLATDDFITQSVARAVKVPYAQGTSSFPSLITPNPRNPVVPDSVDISNKSPGVIASVYYNPIYSPVM